jgi:hypothetical protein
MDHNQLWRFMPKALGERGGTSGIRPAMLKRESPFGQDFYIVSAPKTWSGKSKDEEGFVS